MEEKVVDRRVRKTKRQLRLALMKLMADKSIKDISVRELAAIADINRGTFYIHYKDVYDLLSSLEDELADGLVAVCRRHNAKDSEGKTYPYLMELYQYIEQNSDLCHVLLGKNGDIAFRFSAGRCVRAASTGCAPRSAVCFCFTCCACWRSCFSRCRMRRRRQS